MLLLIFSLPLSVNFEAPSGTSLIFPSELIVGLLVLVFFFRLGVRGNSISFSREFLRHPVTIMLIFYFFTLMFSSVFSTMPLVSLKAVIVKFCYLLVFYFMMHHFLNTSGKNYTTVFLLYGFALLGVVLYALIKHASLGLIKNYSAQSVSLFYNDHTMYSSALAFVIPAFIACLFFGKTLRTGKMQQAILIGTILLVVGLYFSFSRAAWISMFAALVAFLLLLVKARFFTFIVLILGVVTYISFNYDSLKNSFQQNKVDSNVRNAGFYEQTRSITNITSDVSNAERLNRWSCAIRMFSDKPMTGFGPGTYQFQYFPYQRKDEMTRISVTSPYNIPQGHGGSTHSEYLMTLSESGLFSFLAFIGLFLTSLYAAVNIVRTGDYKNRVTASFVFLGLVTYFTHGIFNNFLDNDKLAFLFWASLSMLVSIDLHASQNRQTDERRV
jgi:putative inorganic carbon (hco3(-)) transporter